MRAHAHARVCVSISVYIQSRMLSYIPTFIFLQDLVAANVCMTEATIKDALDKLSGAVTIVYPMGLPPHDPIRMEFEGTEDLTGTQVINPIGEFPSL